MFFTISTIMSSLFNDITLKNDSFICSLPITRKKFIISKYMFPLIFSLLILSINIFIVLIVNLIGIIELRLKYLFFSALSLNDFYLCYIL